MPYRFSCRQNFVSAKVVVSLLRPGHRGIFHVIGAVKIAAGIEMGTVFTVKGGNQLRPGLSSSASHWQKERV